MIKKTLFRTNNETKMNNESKFIQDVTLSLHNRRCETLSCHNSRKAKPVLINDGARLFQKDCKPSVTFIFDDFVFYVEKDDKRCLVKLFAGKRNQLLLIMVQDYFRKTILDGFVLNSGKI